MQGPAEDVRHGDDRDGHDDAVGAVDEVREAAQRDDPRSPGEPATYASHPARVGAGK